MSTLAEWHGRLAYQPLSLGAVALATSAALVFANQLTRPAIFAADERDLQASLIEVLPEGFADNNLLKDTLSITRDDGEPIISENIAPFDAFEEACKAVEGDIVALSILRAQGVHQIGTRVILPW